MTSMPSKKTIKLVTTNELALLVQDNTKDTNKLTLLVQSNTKDIAVVVKELREFRHEFHQYRTDMKDKIDRVKEDLVEIRKDLDFLTKRTKEDDDAYGSDILKINKRVKELEYRVKELATVAA